jgi:hypothetical protein
MVIASSFSQNKDEKNRQVGFLVGSLVPINYFGVSPLEVSGTPIFVTWPLWP